MSTAFGEEWSVANIIPKVCALKAQNNYLQRVIAVYALQSMIPCFSALSSMDILFPILSDLAKDKVANVRFTVAKALGSLFLHIKGQSESEAGPFLSKISNLLLQLKTTDVDKDVKFFTEKVCKYAVPSYEFS